MAMITETIFTKDYIFLLDKESGVKKNDYFINPKPGYKIRRFKPRSGWESVDPVKCDKVIAYKKINLSAKNLDLPLLPNWDKQHDYEEFAYNYTFDQNGHKWSNNNDEAGDNFGSFIAGFKKAQEINNDKQFTLEDIEKAMDLARKGHISSGYNGECEFYYLYNDGEIIDDIQSDKLPKKFLPEFEKEVIGSISGTEYIDIKLKTIGTLEGEEVVGRWVF